MNSMSLPLNSLAQCGGLIFGQGDLPGMASYWPTPTAIKNDPIVAGKMNSFPKYVFSKTLEKVDWNNTRLIKGDAVVELNKLKQQSGNDLFIFGSAKLSSTFTQNGLIDEYRLMVNPIVLSGGVPIIRGKQWNAQAETAQYKILP